MLSSAQLTQLYQNFNITAGGVITITRKGEFVHFNGRKPSSAPLSLLVLLMSSTTSCFQASARRSGRTLTGEQTENLPLMPMGSPLPTWPPCGMAYLLGTDSQGVL